MSFPRARTLLCATLTLAVLAAPAAQADPVDPADPDLGGVIDTHEESLVGADATPPPVHDEHADGVQPGAHGDVFGETLMRAQDPFVALTPEPMAQHEPVEPATIAGTMPDLADLPAEWLQGLPAEQIEPATQDELTLPAGVDPYVAANQGLSEAVEQAEAEGTVDGEVTPMAVPAPPRKSLPSTLDASTGWQPTVTCDPNDRAGMIAFAELVSNHYSRQRYYTSRTCLAGDFSQHYEGRALDWPLNAYNSADRAIADSVNYWLTANHGEMARRFGINYIIFNRRIWYIYDQTWRAYSGPSPHTDHIHFTFSWDGAMKRTSWWDGTPVRTSDVGPCRVYQGQYAPRYSGRRTAACPTSLPAPPSTPYPVVLPTAVNDHVARAQRAMGFTGSDVDGAFGPITLRALLRYQGNNGVPVTGVLGNATWDVMDGNSPPQAAPERISGKNRYATAAALAQGHRGGDVYVATGGSYRDALAAAARAGSRGDPVLLVSRTGIPSSTASALRSIDPSRIILVGNTSAVISRVQTQLRGYAGSGGVIRRAGSTSYGTAGSVSRLFGNYVNVVYITSGQTYPDTLAAAARAGYNDAPVLLAKRNYLPSETRAALAAINPYRVVIIGGTATISTSLHAQLRSYTRSGNLQRVGGADRYATAADLAAYYPTGLDRVYVASGTKYPDALAAAAAAGDEHVPVLLVTKYGIPSATRARLAAMNPDDIVVVGGRATVSSQVVRGLRALED